jgi:CRISPR-associated endonuclease Cas2
MNQFALPVGRHFLFVLYDVKDNKLRAKLSKELEELGLRRSQWSVLHDPHERTDVAHLIRMVERLFKRYPSARVLILRSDILYAFGYSNGFFDHPYQDLE